MATAIYVVLDQMVMCIINHEGDSLVSDIEQLLLVAKPRYNVHVVYWGKSTKQQSKYLDVSQHILFEH